MACFAALIHLLVALIQFGFCFALVSGYEIPESDAAVFTSHALYTVYPSTAGNSPLTVTATLYLTLPAHSSRSTNLPGRAEDSSQRPSKSTSLLISIALELRYLRDTENEEWSVLRAAKDSIVPPTTPSTFMSTCSSEQTLTDEIVSLLAMPTTSSAATTYPLENQDAHSTASKFSPTTTPCPAWPTSTCRSNWARLSDDAKSTKRTCLDQIFLQTTLIAERLEKLNDFVDDLGEVWEMLMVLICGFFGYAVGSLLIRMKKAWVRC
ncbi:hypothetical protein IWZ01DRAFT_485749 [Phyllosticta capitalensis]